MKYIFFQRALLSLFCFCFLFTVSYAQESKFTLKNYQQLGITQEENFQKDYTQEIILQKNDTQKESLHSEISHEKPAPLDVYTLQQAVEYALEENPLTFNAELSVEQSKYDVRSAYGALLPNIQAEYGFGYNMGFPAPNEADQSNTHSRAFEWSVSATQPLFAGFALLSARDQVLLAKESQELSQRQTDLLIGMQVQNAFISLLQNEETIKSTLRAIARAQEQYDFIKASYELSLRPKLDLLQAELELASFKNTLIQVENTRNTSLVNLQTLLALPISSKAEFIGTLKQVDFDKDFEECLNLAMENRNDIRMGKLAVSMAEAGKTITDSSFYPRIVLIAAYSERDENTFRYPADDRGVSVGLGITWDIFNGTRRYNESAKARIEISKARYSLIDTMNNVAKEVKTLYETMQEAKKSIEITTQAVKLAEESYALALARYENGVGTNLDLLIGQASLAEQEANYTNALAGYLLALSSLYAAMGEVHVLDL